MTDPQAKRLLKRAERATDLARALLHKIRGMDNETRSVRGDLMRAAIEIQALARRVAR